MTLSVKLVWYEQKLNLESILYEKVKHIYQIELL